MRVKEEKADDAGDVLLLLHPEFIELLAFRAGARNLGTCTVRQHRPPTPRLPDEGLQQQRCI
jgi:hypothetical protein